MRKPIAILYEHPEWFRPLFAELERREVCEEGCATCPYLPRAAQIVRWPLEDPTELPAERRADALRAIGARLESLSTTLTTQS